MLVDGSIEKDTLGPLEIVQLNLDGFPTRWYVIKGNRRLYCLKEAFTPDTMILVKITTLDDNALQRRINTRSGGKNIIVQSPFQ